MVPAKSRQAREQPGAADGRKLAKLPFNELRRILDGSKDTLISLTIKRAGTEEPITGVWDLGGLRLVALDSTVPGWHHGELGPEYHEVRIAKQPLEIKGPLVTLSNRPGLGVDVDWDVVRDHKLS